MDITHNCMDIPYITMFKKMAYWRYGKYGIALGIFLLVIYFLRNHFRETQNTHTIAELFKRAQIPPGSKTAM